MVGVQDMRRRVAKFRTQLGAGALAIWSAGALFAYLVGLSTVPDDLPGAVEQLFLLVGWLLRTPWYIPAIFASVLFFWALPGEDEAHPGNQAPQDFSMPLPFVVRHVGHHSKWCLSPHLQHQGWVEEADKEIARRLANGQLQAWAIWKPTYGEKGNAPSLIKPDEWTLLSWDSRRMAEMGAVHNFAHQYASPSAGAGGTYSDIRVSQSVVETIWPRRSFLSRMIRKSPPERVGELERWLKRNDHLPKGSPFLWR